MNKAKTTILMILGAKGIGNVLGPPHAVELEEVHGVVFKLVRSSQVHNRQFDPISHIS